MTDTAPPARKTAADARRLGLAEAYRRIRPNGGWATVEEVAAAMETPARAQAAASAPTAASGDAGAAHGGEGGAEGESGAPAMRPEDVPSDLVDDAVDAWHDAPRDEHGNRPMLDDLMRYILAAVIPAIEQRVRAQVADEIERGFYDAGGYLDAATERATRDILRRLRGDQ